MKLCILFLIPILVFSIQPLQAQQVLDSLSYGPQLPLDDILEPSKSKIQFSGEVESRTNFFIDDDNLFTSEDRANGSVPKQYTNDKTLDRMSNETWTFLRFDYQNWSLSTRYDVFQNSNLKNPLGSFTAAGIGMVNLAYQGEKTRVELGSIYHQLGKGTAFRSYEERGQQLDNSLIGALFQYNLTSDLQLKAITGFPKKDPTQISERSAFQTLNIVSAMVVGINLDYIYKNTSYGLGIVSRKLEQPTVNALQTSVDLFQSESAFEVNPWATIFNYYQGINFETLSINWDLAYKTVEALYKYKRGVRQAEVYNEDGYSLRLTMQNYVGNLSSVVKFRALKNFEFRSNPNAEGNDGFVNFYAPLSRFNERRLTGRYVPNVQYQDEIGIQADFYYKWNRKLKSTLNLSDIRTSENILVYNEVQLQTDYKFSRYLKTTVGLQYFHYNQLVNQAEGDLVKGFVPYVDATWKVFRGQALKGELSSMHTEDDFGDWLWLNLEYQVSGFTIAAGDMYNFGNMEEDRKIHYFNFYTSYRIGEDLIGFGNGSLGLAYVKQPKTVVCNGGVCRIEPAFNGVRFDLKLNI